MDPINYQDIPNCSPTHPQGESQNFRQKILRLGNGFCGSKAAHDGSAEPNVQEREFSKEETAHLNKIENKTKKLLKIANKYVFLDRVWYQNKMIERGIDPQKFLNQTLRIKKEVWKPLQEKILTKEEIPTFIPKANNLLRNLTALGIARLEQSTEEVREELSNAIWRRSRRVEYFRKWIICGLINEAQEKTRDYPKEMKDECSQKKKYSEALQELLETSKELIIPVSQEPTELGWDNFFSASPFSLNDYDPNKPISINKAYRDDLKEILIKNQEYFKQFLLKEGEIHLDDLFDKLCFGRDLSRKYQRFAEAAKAKYDNSSFSGICTKEQNNLLERTNWVKFSEDAVQLWRVNCYLEKVKDLLRRSISVTTFLFVVTTQDS